MVVIDDRMLQRSSWQRASAKLSSLARARGIDLDAVLYPLVAGTATLWVACLFYSSMQLQLRYALLWAAPDRYADIVADAGFVWSAPLDDVFIHFDFARSAARGHLLQWSIGNGYSSGGTSLLYPLTLAVGIWLGFDGLSLMVWAALLACVCVFATLLAARRMFSGLPLWTSYIAPFALLAVGALDWTLFSGMEVALFLALWGGALLAWSNLLDRPISDSVAWRAALPLGLWGAVLVAARPEAATTVGVFALTAAGWFWRRRTRRFALEVLGVASLPGALVVVLQSVANWVFTGETTAAGALVKLEIHHPFLTAGQAFDAWLFHLKYQVLRITQYHLSDSPFYGWIIWIFAIVPFFSPKTRRYAVLLWSSAFVWTLMVALNGQVRWQNERYSMPALAWLLLAAGLGVAVLLSQSLGHGRRGSYLRGLSVAGALGLATIFGMHQAPRFREQVWFFGRASRNIFDQHVRVGALIRSGVLEPKPRRVLVGDAGAIPYVADVPALDIIGLGGYRNLPFARATRQGVAAALELIERVPAIERPDLFALYPSWWGAFPVWFGDRIHEVPVRGNVICGGPSKVLYQANWGPFEGSAQPFQLRSGEAPVDELDVADLVSERAHDYRLSGAATGQLVMKMLADPRDARRDLWDAGRIVPPGIVESFRLRPARPRHPARLLMRLAAAKPSTFVVRLDGVTVSEVSIEPTDGWQQIELSLPKARVDDFMIVEIEPRTDEHALYHLWLVQER